MRREIDSSAQRLTSSSRRGAARLLLLLCCCLLPITAARCGGGSGHSSGDSTGDVSQTSDQSPADAGSDVSGADDALDLSDRTPDLEADLALDLDAHALPDTPSDDAQTGDEENPLDASSDLGSDSVEDQTLGDGVEDQTLGDTVEDQTLGDGVEDQTTLDADDGLVDDLSSSDTQSDAQPDAAPEICKEDCLSGKNDCQFGCLELPGVGKYVCTCPEGMALVDGKNCVTPCPPGTTGSDGNCVNINECAGTPCNDQGDHDDNSGQDGQGCTEIALNTWQAPGYTCSCEAGYVQGIGIGGYRTCVIGDECSSGANNCSPSAICKDPNPAPSSLGDYTCSCPSGYEGDGRTTGTGCTDIDECKKTPGICDNGPLVGAVCKNRPGGYDCVCPEGQVQFGNECLLPCP